MLGVDIWWKLYNAKNSQSAIFCFALCSARCCIFGNYNRMKLAARISSPFSLHFPEKWRTFACVLCMFPQKIVDFFFRTNSVIAAVPEILKGVQTVTHVEVSCLGKPMLKQNLNRGHPPCKKKKLSEAN